MIAKFQPLPDHTQLPDSDGAIVENMQEHPQAMLLTDSILPVVRLRHPDGRFCIGSDCGIYWRNVDPPLDGCKAPDWFYVPWVSPKVDGKRRRSYVMWEELIAPRVLAEFVSGDGSDERDRTPWRGKFWVYEQILQAPYYAIYDVDRAHVEVNQLVAGAYHLVEPNERGHFPIPLLGVELGIWHGRFMETEFPWLRWWDSRGELLLTGWERAEQEAARAEQEAARAEQEAARAEQEAARAKRLAERLRELGVDPDHV